MLNKILNSQSKVFLPVLVSVCLLTISHQGATEEANIKPLLLALKADITADLAAIDKSRTEYASLLEKIDANVAVLTNDEVSREEGRQFLQTELVLGFPPGVLFSQGPMIKLLDSGLLDVADPDLAASLRNLRSLLNTYNGLRDGNYNLLLKIVAPLFSSFPFPTSIFAEPPYSNFLWAEADEYKLMFYVNAYLSLKRISVQTNLEFYGKYENLTSAILEAIEAHL